MKVLLVLLSLLTIQATFAAQCLHPKGLKEILACYQEIVKENGAIQSPCPEAQKSESNDLIYVKGSALKILPGLTKGFSKENADCTSFIKSDGTYGPWGTTVKDYISKSPARSYFLNPSHIAEVCPRFDKFSEQEKDHFWVWTIAAISWDESRCISGRRNTHASNGVATGLLQLDEQKKARYWRGPSCNVKSVAKADSNIKCGLDILGELLKGKKGVYKGSGAIFRSKSKNASYWEKLTRPGGGTIGKLIESYPNCNDPMI